MRTISRLRVIASVSLRPRPADGQHHGAARFAFEPSDRVVEPHSLGGLAVDFENLVAGHQPGSVRRRSHQRADHHKLAPFDPNLDADPRELLGDRRLEARHVVRGDIVGVLVELFQHPVDCRFDQFPPIDRLDVVALHLVDRIDKQFLQRVVVGHVRPERVFRGRKRVRIRGTGKLR